MPKPNITVTRKPAGFTVLEVLMVVGIAVIVAALAIPRVRHARIARNEASALQSLRAINSAQISYAQVYPNKGGSACQLSYLGPPLGTTAIDFTAADLIDLELSSGVKSEYTFSMNCTPADANGKVGYEVKAAPTGTDITAYTCGTNNGRCFYTNSSGKVYQLVGAGNSNGTAFDLKPIP